MMSEERARRLREWHEQAYEAGARTETITVTQLGWSFVVPPDVYPPNPLGLAEVVLAEVRESDRVLDLGTGSGVNAVVAASRSADVVAVDVNPLAVECASLNARSNGVESRLDVRESNLFENVDGRFDLIVFDPPFRWFRPRDLRERGTADENYETLTAFFGQSRDYLTLDGRILLSFGTSGDIDYLRHVVAEARFHSEEVRRTDLVKAGFRVAYFDFRPTPLS
jgi:release factor glutamine methyltransferase